MKVLQKNTTDTLRDISCFFVTNISFTFQSAWWAWKDLTPSLLINLFLDWGLVRISCRLFDDVQVALKLFFFWVSVTAIAENVGMQDNLSTSVANFRMLWKFVQHGHEFRQSVKHSIILSDLLVPTPWKFCIDVFFCALQGQLRDEVSHVKLQWWCRHFSVWCHYAVIGIKNDVIVSW